MKHRILLVEDEASVVHSVRSILRDDGFDCVVVSSLEEALLQLETQEFCGLVTDLGIPASATEGTPDGELGLRLIRRARERYPAFVQDDSGFTYHLFGIFVLSGLGSHRMREAVHLGASDFLTKPLGTDKKSLSETIAEWFLRVGRRHHRDCAAINHRARRTASSPSLPVETLLPAIVDLSARGRDSSPSLSEISIEESYRPLELGITGRLIAGRYEISVDGLLGTLPPALFLALLKLIEAHLSGRPWMTNDALGSAAGAGWRGKYLMKKEIGNLLAGRLLIDNSRKREYRLAENVALGCLRLPPIVLGPDPEIASVARTVDDLLGAIGMSPVA